MSEITKERLALATMEPEIGVQIDIQLVDVGGIQFERITPIAKNTLGMKVFKIYTTDTMYIIKVIH